MQHPASAHFVSPLLNEPDCIHAGVFDMLSPVGRGILNMRIAALIAAGCLALGTAVAHADANRQTKGSFEDKFRQLEVDLPTPNSYRTASGAPGEAYWQQKADYQIEVRLDESQRRLTGRQTVTYRNNSPHPLPYLWFQLDQNHFKKDSVARITETASANAQGQDTLSIANLRRMQTAADIPYGVELQSVTNTAGAAVPYVINDTMMRVDLPRPLAPGQATSLRMAWAYNITDNNIMGGRSGFERIAGTDHDIFFIAQWFPRMVAYTDYTGWQHKQFLGRGEFTLEFGDYDVAITVPSDHVVASTGTLLNPNEALTAQQRARLAQAKTAKKAPMYIVTPDEAVANEKEGTSATRTWRFKAENVRDFAFASSRRFIWDAMTVDQPEGQDVLAQSFFPVEADPLWSLYSTRAVAHTIDVYSSFSFPYPYPAAISVNTWERGGMEYPMISFNGYRPVKDEKTGQKTYTRNAKYGLIGVVIHEVGHNYFPMIVNSDERQWTWMDEGLNSFLEYMAELRWEEGFPTNGGLANVLEVIPAYMMSENQVPIMTNSESIPQFGPNAYTKPTAALSVLRETVMGPKLFDHAFKEFAQRWRFKRPTPSDFFRTMEDASGVDLDWFWRGWFYTTDHVDIALSAVREYKLATRNPEADQPLARTQRQSRALPPVTVQQNREAGVQTYIERNPDAKDFYNENDEFVVSNKDRNDYQGFLEGLRDPEKSVFERALKEDPFIYFVDFRNTGGLVSPLPVKLTYEDGSTREMTIPAEIWRMDNTKVTRMFVEPKRVTSFELDARNQIADADETNNTYPARLSPSRLDVFRSQQPPAARNQMADALVELRAKEPATGGTAAPIVRTPPSSPVPTF
jgi:hypothetical protein